MWRWRAAKRKRFLSSMYVTFKCHLGEDAAVSLSATVASQNSPSVSSWQKCNRSLMSPANVEGRAKKTFKELVPHEQPSW